MKQVNSLVTSWQTELGGRQSCSWGGKPWDLVEKPERHSRSTSTRESPWQQEEAGLHVLPTLGASTPEVGSRSALGHSQASRARSYTHILALGPCRLQTPGTFWNAQPFDSWWPVASDLSNIWDVIPFLDTCLPLLSLHTEALGPVKAWWELSPGSETCSRPASRTFYKVLFGKSPRVPHCLAMSTDYTFGRKILEFESSPFRKKVIHK